MEFYPPPKFARRAASESSSTLNMVQELVEAKKLKEERD